MHRLRWTPLLLVALLTTGATCNNKKTDGGDLPTVDVEEVPLVELEGIDTKVMSPAEHRKWSAYVNEFNAPCTEVPVTVAGCIKEKRECARCKPAAELLMRMVRAGRPKTDVAAVYNARFDDKALKTIAIGS